MADLKEISSTKCFGGQQKVYTHTSAVCKCTMTFGIYIPLAVIDGTIAKAPALYNLGGLGSKVSRTVTTSHYQKYAAQHCLVVVCPDSSPRDTGLPNDKGSIRSAGEGAGSYMDATEPGWRDHYNMFSYVTQELVQLIETEFEAVLPGRRGIMGQSMGGHGSLLCALKRPDLYTSVSSFYPGANPMVSFPEIFETYLGTDKELWKQWDASELMKAYTGRPLDILVLMGTRDHLLKWLPALVTAAHGKDNISLDIKLHAGYAHNGSYVNTMMEYVIKYHAELLLKCIA